MRTYEPMAGDDISEVCEAIANMVVECNEPVKSSFNGIKIMAEVGSTAEELQSSWRKILDSKKKEYRESPKGKASAKRQERFNKKVEFDVTDEKTESMRTLKSNELIGNIREFPLRTVLSVTTGRLLTKSNGDPKTMPRTKRDNGIGDMYQFLNHMTGDNAFTHQLGRFADECKPWLLRWYPELKTADDRLDDLDNRLESDGFSGCESWIRDIENEIGEFVSVGQIPRDDHEVKNPYDEAVSERGTDEGIILVGIKSSEKEQ